MGLGSQSGAKGSRAYNLGEQCRKKNGTPRPTKGPPQFTLRHQFATISCPDTPKIHKVPNRVFIVIYQILTDKRSV